MEFILMHKDVEVAKINLDENNAVKTIVMIYRQNHLPFSADNIFSFREWWNDRSIPLTRDDYQNIRNNLPHDNSFSLVVKSHALSLTDQYWIKREGEEIRYDDISFFSNAFSNDIGDILLGEQLKGKPSYYSPDSTSIGNLKKRWKIIEGKRYLLKSGTKPYHFEVMNEIIASKIMNVLGIDHVEYELYHEGKNIFCRSLDFISYNEDFISAYQLKNSKKKRNDISLYDHLLSVLEDIKIPNYKTKINQMLFVDYLIGNVDRHLNNFGVIRDAKTLEFTRFAPIFDSGSSLGFDVADDELNKLVHVEWMPFKSQKNQDQLSLIDDYSWLNLDALQSVPQLIDQFLKSYECYLPSNRRQAVLNFLIKRINYIYRYLKVDKEVSLRSVDLTCLEEDILQRVYNNNKLIDLEFLANEYDVAYITIYRAVSSLVKKGLLKRTGSRKNGYWILP